MKGAEGKPSSDMIVLPAQFYDLNRWDPDDRAERTRRRWRKDIEEVLKQMAAEALEPAAEILYYEGLSIENAA